MQKEISILMASRFDGQEVLRQSITARYQLLGGEARLMYKQKLDPESPRETPEVLTVLLDEAGQPQRVQMKRPGSKFSLAFASGETCMALYETPAGLLKVELLTQQIKGQFTPDAVWLELTYELRLGGESQGKTELWIRS